MTEEDFLTVNYLVISFYIYPMAWVAITIGDCKEHASFPNRGPRLLATMMEYTPLDSANSFVDYSVFRP